MMEGLKSYYSKYRIRINMIAINILIAVLPIIIIGVIAYKINYDNMKKSAFNSVDILLNQINGRLEDYFSNVDSISKSIFYSKNLQTEIIDGIEEYTFVKYNSVRDYLDSYLEINNSIKGICIYDINKQNYYMTTMSNGDNFIDFLKLESDERINSGAMQIIAPFDKDGKVKDDFFVVRGIKSILRDDYFKLFCVGAIVLDRKKLESMIFSSHNTSNFEVFIVDGQSKIIAATSYKENEKSIREYIEKSEKSLTSYVKINNRDFLIKSNNVKNTNWSIVAIIQEDKLLKELDVIQYSITVIIAIIFFIVIIINFFFNAVVTKPFKQITDAFDRVASGDLKYKLDVKDENEITAIAEKFNNMIDEIKILTKNILNTQQQLYETELKKKQFELNGLQTQINSHFLYNTLNCIEGMALAGAKREIVQMVDNLSTFLRYGTRNNEYVSIEDEIRHLKKYICIQEIRFGSKFKVIYEIDKAVLDSKILKLTIQPMVENAIFHGLEQKQGNGVIKILAYEENGELIIKVLDNGVGIEPKALDTLNKELEGNASDDALESSGRGIGIANINKRVKLYYGNMYGLSIKSRRNLGTAVVIRIPALNNVTVPLL